MERDIPTAAIELHQELFDKIMEALQDKRFSSVSLFEAISCLASLSIHFAREFEAEDLLVKVINELSNNADSYTPN